MKKILDQSVGDYKPVSELDGVEFGDDLVIMSESNASSVMRRVVAYSEPMFSRIDRFITEVGGRVFIDYIRPGYTISGNGLESFHRVNGSDVTINVSKICMIESCWLAEFNYQDSYDYEIRPMAVLVRINDDVVREMLKTGNID
jgi:hypothetical protein